MSLHIPYLTHLASSQENHLPTWSNELQFPRPFSSFTQTLLEEDEKFYATFPDARKAATEQGWSYQHVPHGQYFEGAGFQFYPELSGYTKMSYYYGGHSSDAQAFGYAADGGAVSCYTEATPSPSDTNYDYSPLTEASMSSALPLNPVLHTTSLAEQRNGSMAEVHPNELHKAYNTCRPASAICLSSPVSPAVPEGWDFPVVPSHQPMIDEGLMQPLVVPPLQGLLDRSPSPSPECASSSTLPSPLSQCARGNHHNRSPTPEPVGVIGRTGDWRADELSHQMLHAPVPRHPAQGVGSLDASITGPSTRSRLLTRRPQKTRRSQSHPYIGAKATSRPSSCMRLSAPPIKGRVKRIVQSKPPLACLFCRGRKIACGAPPAGSEKKSCNQCDKRGLRCAFPLESYRGVRRKQRNLCEILATNHNQFKFEFNT